MAKQEIRFGIIGCGLMGREFASASARWCHLLSQDAQPKIVAVCDPNAQAMQWFQENVPSVHLASADYHDLLGSSEVDAVYCAVPHNLHESVYIDIIRAGKHLLGEKPFGIDQAANNRILAAIAEHPELLVRCSSEFPFFPGPQRIAKFVQEERFGTIIEVQAGFLHSSDLDPMKPINWKRRVATNGAYGCMGDLGMHVLHMPLRFGWKPANVRALLSRIIPQRPGPDNGAMVPCETWDNATLACEACARGQTFPMTLATKRISPGDTNTWYLKILGTRFSAEFTTKQPKTLRTMSYTPGGPQAWQVEDLGAASAYPTITGGIFEFGFSDSILQMWAAFCDELVHLGGGEMRQPFMCATPEEAAASHAVFTAALKSQAEAQVALVDGSY